MSIKDSTEMNTDCNHTFLLDVQESLLSDSTMITDSSLCCCYCEQASNTEEDKGFIGSSSFANIIASAAIIVTLGIFIWQTIESRKERKRTLKENWYLTIILQQNIEGINNYYNDAANGLASEIKRIRDHHANETREKAKSIRKLQVLKNDFFNNFVTLLQSYDKTIAQKVDDILNEVLDLNSTAIDNYNGIGIDDCVRQIYSNKTKLISALYKGISVK